MKPKQIIYWCNFMTRRRQFYFTLSENLW